MTDLPMNTGQQSLGVGKIVGDTVSLFISQIANIFVLAFLPTLAIVLIQYWLTPNLDPNDPAFNPADISVGGQLLGVIVAMVGMSIISALVIRLAYDAKVGNPIRPGAYFSSAIAVVVPLVICTIIISLAVGIAAIALLVPGLWLWAVWCCVTPAIVIENAGFGSFGRSAELTKEYRWPCLGALLVVGICAYIPILIIAMIFGFSAATSGFGFGSIVYLLVNALATVIYMAAIGICTSLIYARLREIKEGTSVEQLAEVFA
jgi:hypothetical protein